MVDANNKKVFRLIRHLIPAFAADAIPAISDDLRFEVTSWGWSSSDINEFIGRARFRRQQTGDGDNLVACFNNLRQRSAIFVTSAHLYRFGTIRGASISQTSIWTGMTTRLGTSGQLQAPHIFELARRILPIAQTKDSLVVLLCETTAPLTSEWPDDLRSSDGIAILNGGFSQAEAATRRFEDLSKAVKDGTAPEQDWNRSVAEIVEEPSRRALLIAQLWFIRGEPFRAWASLEPYIKQLDGEAASNRLFAANVALSASRQKQAVELLEGALRSDLSTLEDIHFAHQLATQIDLPSAGGLYSRLTATFPHDHRVVALRMETALGRGDLVDAQACAKTIGDDFVAQLCAAFAVTPPNLEELFDFASRLGQQDRAFVAAAGMALARNAPEVALECAHSVSEDSTFFGEAVKIRIQLVAQKAARAQFGNDEVELLSPLIQFVARHPANLKVRNQLEEFFEERLEEPAACAILARSVMRDVSRLMTEIRDSDFSFDRNITDEASGEVTSAETTQFFESFMQSLPTTGLILGHSELPLALRSRCSPDLGYQLYKMVDVVPLSTETAEADIRFLFLLLHAIALVGRELADPAHDLLSVQLAIGRISAIMAHQQARNLAETALIHLTRAQPKLLDWRTGHGWTCYAEAYHRAHHTLAALRTLCLSFSIQTDPLRHRHAFCANLRLAARILRDVGYGDQAIEVLECEREIQAAGGSKQSLLQIDLVNLSIELTRLDRKADQQWIYSLLTRAESILTKTEMGEIAPPLNCIAHLIKALRQRGYPLPASTEGAFQQGLGRVSRETTNLLLDIVNPTPNKTDLLSALRRIGPAQHWDDLSYQALPLRSLACRAIDQATLDGDSDFWLLASALLSQPALTARLIDSTSEENAAAARLRRFAMTTASEATDRPESLAGAIEAMRNAGPEPQRSLISVVETSAAEILERIDPSESVLALARGSDEKLYSLVLPYPVGQTGKPMLEPDWSPTRFEEWKRSFPYGYLDWSEELDINRVRESVSGLDIGQFPGAQAVTIAPDAGLFGFSFNLLQVGGDFAAEKSQISVVPSLPWLMKQRNSSPAINGSKIAWLGHPTRCDEVLAHLRGVIAGQLATGTVKLSEEMFLPDLSGSSLAVVACHGRVGFLHHFRSLTDGYSTFSPEEFARKLENSGVVVLLSCSAGRTDSRTHSMEAAGVVTSLLAHGVRAVISPLWPIPVLIPEIWIGPFLQSLLSGSTVGQAAAAGTRALREKFNHPCAWAALAVFGDQQLTVG